jgi:hypothetical protein
MHDAPLDGNAAAGILSEVFVAEMTVAITTCATCGAVAQVGQLPAYLSAPGAVLRCAGCGAAHVRVVRGRDRVWIDLRGVQVLQVGVESA